MRHGIALILGLGVSFGLCSAPAAGEEGGDRARTAFQGGPFVLIGGAAVPDNVMRRILQLAGGAKARIVVVASDTKAAGAAGKAAQARFKKLGGGDVQVVIPNGEPTANQAATFHQATAFFFADGDQRAFLGKLSRPSWLGALHGAWRRGAVIAGSGAGAMVWGDHAILSTKKDQASTMLGSGFGLLGRSLVETDFSERGRFSRLLYATVKHAPDVGFGIDPGTALLLTDDGWAEVIGQGSVTLARPTGRPAATMPLSVPDARIRILAAGERLDLAQDPVFRLYGAQALVP